MFVCFNMYICTLITTDVTLLSTQKNVSERRAYCSENFRIVSTLLSAGSTADSTYTNTMKMV